MAKTNQDFLPILKKIGKTTDLVILVVDLLNINDQLDEIKQYIKNPVLLVLTKRDILPLSVSDEKLKQVSKKIPMNIVDTILISSYKNTNLDELMEKIYTYKTSTKVYVIGYTNAGKSTMINKIIYNYFDTDIEITTSMIPSTTLNSIEITLNDELTMIDTPGILNMGDICHFVDIKTLKKITPKKEIKPITYQIKSAQSILLDDLVRIDLEDKNNVTIYVSNQIKMERTYHPKEKFQTLEKHELDLQSHQDIVISGLGFLKFTNKGHVIIYTIPNVHVFVRDNLI